MALPQFLCIGAPKSGTTWLHHQLQRHPEIWVPPMKELHFFDLADGQRYLWKLGAKNREGKHARAALAAGLRHLPDLPWALKYLLSPQKPNQYGRFFPEERGLTCGEVTPSYGRLPLATVKQIHRLMPQTKIIYLLRNPIERVWSHIHMILRNRGQKAGWDVNDVIAQRGDLLFSISNYAQTLSQWERVFSPNQFFVGFYDDLTQQPQQLLSNVFQFLGVDDRVMIPKSQLQEKHFAGVYREPSPAEKKNLIEMLLPSMAQLSERYPHEAPAHWFVNAQEELSKLSAQS